MSQDESKTPKLSQLHERIAKEEARQAAAGERAKRLKKKLREQERKERTRKAIVVGQVLLTHADANPDFEDLMWTILNKAVTRDIDRALLNLPPRGSAGDINIRDHIKAGAKPPK